jgi:hypothetical protein
LGFEISYRNKRDAEEKLLCGTVRGTLACRKTLLKLYQNTGHHVIVIWLRADQIRRTETVASYMLLD